MKHLRIIALILSILIVCSLAVACGPADEKAEDTNTTTTTTKKTTTTTKLDLEIPDDPEIVPEKPVTGEDWRAWHDSMSTVQGLNPSVSGLPVVWNDGAVENVFDGKDGVINTEEQTKLGGGDSGGVVTLSFQAPNSTLIAYTLITGNDTGVNDVKDRTPGSWILYGATTEDGEYVELDVVDDGAMVETPATPFGYTIDADKQGEYSFYKIEFNFGVNGTLNVIQLNEIYLYEAAAQ